MLAEILASGLAASAVAFQLTAAWSARRFARTRTARFPGAGRPMDISVLRPLRGIDAGLRRNLESCCEQDGVRVQLVCGVADPDDPAIAVVRELQSSRPDLDVDLVIDRTLHGANYKVSNLLNMLPAARFDRIAIADADVRVGRNWARHLIAELSQPRVGLVTCLYRAVAEAGDLPSRLECLFVNTHFAAMVSAAQVIERRRYAFGATMALERATLQRAGGLQMVADHLADDYEIGRRVADLGLEVRLSAERVDTITRVRGWRHLFRHLLRWARTYRTCRPWGFLGTAVTHAIPIALALLVAGHPVAALAVLCARLAGAASAARALGTRLSPLEWALLPFSDLLIGLVWIAAWFGNTVWWGERAFRVSADGRLTELGPAARPLPVISPGTDPLGGDQEAPSH